MDESFAQALADKDIKIAKLEKIIENSRADASKWKNDANEAAKKLKEKEDDFNTEQIESYHPFRDEIGPFFVKYAPASLADFDVETRDMDKDVVNGEDTAKDIGLDKQHDKLVDRGI